MANADKVWQGLSASDMVNEQCCCKSLSIHRLIEVDSQMFIRQLPSSTERIVSMATTTAMIIRDYCRQATYVVTRCVPIMTLAGPY